MKVAWDSWPLASFLPLSSLLSGLLILSSCWPFNETNSILVRSCDLLPGQPFPALLGQLLNTSFKKTWSKCHLFQKAVPKGPLSHTQLGYVLIVSYILLSWHAEEPLQGNNHKSDCLFPVPLTPWTTNAMRAGVSFIIVALYLHWLWHRENT